MHILIQYTFFTIFYITIILITYNIINKRKNQNTHPPNNPKLLTFSINPPINHNPQLIIPINTNTNLQLKYQTKNIKKPIQINVTKNYYYNFIKIL